MSTRPILEIPVSAAKDIADRYGYDQVVIIARRVGDEPEPHGEHVTTYARDKAHCGVAARVGNFIKHKIMGWPEYEPTPKAQADARDDSALLDAMERQRIAVVPEYEGPWDAEVYNGDEKPNHCGSGSTPREAIRAAIAAQAAQQGGAA